MATKVAVNGRTVVHADSAGVSVAAPDVCLTPAGPAVVPIPYPNIAQSKDASKTACDVKADSKKICLANSNLSQSNGDEAGTGGGVASGVNRNKAEFVQSSSNVRIEGQGVPRALDLLVHNSKNTPPAPIVQPPLPAASKDFSVDDDQLKDNPLAGVD